ncbi:MAG: LytR/AlgR family response regulator transcription factor, partial [Planctomycetota bacterium]
MTRPASTPLRVLIVDDETLARDALRLQLDPHPEVEVVAECADGVSAVERLRRGDVDLVLLDVQMPGMTGFEVVAAVGAEHMPLTVFVTAFEEHALAAFEAEAVDYLLKPVDDDRLANAITRARRRVREADAAERAESLASLLAQVSVTPAAAPERWVSLRTSSRLVRLRESEVDWVEAADY